MNKYTITSIMILLSSSSLAQDSCQNSYTRYKNGEHACDRTATCPGLAKQASSTCP